MDDDPQEIRSLRVALEMKQTVRNRQGVLRLAGIEQVEVAVGGQCVLQAPRCAVSCRQRGQVIRMGRAQDHQQVEARQRLLVTSEGHQALAGAGKDLRLYIVDTRPTLQLTEDGPKGLLSGGWNLRWNLRHEGIHGGVKRERLSCTARRPP